MPLSGASVLLFSACLGFLWLGTIPLTSGLVGTIFGPTHMSMLWGLVFLSHQLGSFLGVWLGQKARRRISPEKFRLVFLVGMLLVGLQMSRALV